MRLLCDEMLARVGRWLRIAGYDTEWCEKGTPDDVVLITAMADGRILLSCDRIFVERANEEVEAYYQESAELKVWVPFLEEALGIDWEHALWSRCIQCNTPIVAHEGERPANAPDDKELFTCPKGCGVFWEGAHARRYKERLDAVRAEVAQSL